MLPDKYFTFDSLNFVRNLDIDFDLFSSKSFDLDLHGSESYSRLSFVLENLVSMKKIVEEKSES